MRALEKWIDLNSNRYAWSGWFAKISCVCMRAHADYKIDSAQETKQAQAQAWTQTLQLCRTFRFSAHFEHTGLEKCASSTCVLNSIRNEVKNMWRIHSKRSHQNNAAQNHPICVSVLLRERMLYCDIYQNISSYYIQRKRQREWQSESELTREDGF